MNLLKDKYPDIFKLLHPTLNLNINLSIITYGSNKLYWWLCPLNPCGCHVYQDSPQRHIIRKVCPYCSLAPIVCVHTSILSNSTLANEFCYDLNKDINPSTISMHSTIKLYWKCNTHITCNEHIWYSSSGSRNLKNNKLTGCSWCSHKCGNICKCDNMMTIPKISNTFCQELNPHIDPYKLSTNSSINIVWKCDLHKGCNEHIWKTSISNRIDKDSNCPYCSHRISCKCDSFMNDEQLAKEFSYELNIGIDPWKLSIGSNKEVWFKCLNHTSCDMHIWKSRIYNRTSIKCGCPFCKQGCQTCKCDSFMSNKILAEQFDYDLNIGIDPYTISKRSGIKLKWRCSCSYIWEASVDHRNDDINPRGCPKCLYKTEEIVYNFLIDKFQNVIRQFKAEWCKNITYLPFDFLITINNINIIIEVDGRQHFENISNWNDCIDTRKRDIFKIKKAIENKYHIIHIFQKFIYNDKLKIWETKLLDAINKIKISEINIPYFISNDDIYSNHIKDLG